MTTKGLQKSKIDIIKDSEIKKIKIFFLLNCIAC